MGTLNDLLSLNEHFGTNHLQEELIAKFVLDILNIVSMLHDIRYNNNLDNDLYDHDHNTTIDMNKLSMQSFLVVHTPPNNNDNKEKQKDDDNKSKQHPWHLQFIGLGATSKSHTNKNSVSEDLYIIADIAYRLLTSGKQKQCLQKQYNNKTNRYEINGNGNSFRGGLGWDTLFDLLLNVPATTSSSSPSSCNLSCLSYKSKKTRWELNVFHAYALIQSLARVGNDNNNSILGEIASSSSSLHSTNNNTLDEFYKHLQFGDSIDSVLKFSSKLQQKEHEQNDNNLTKSVKAASKQDKEEMIENINKKWQEKVKAMEEKHALETKALQESITKLQHERDSAFEKDLEMRREMEKILAREKDLQSTIQSLQQKQLDQHSSCNTFTTPRRKKKRKRNEVQSVLTDCVDTNNNNNNDDNGTLKNATVTNEQNIHHFNRAQKSSPGKQMRNLQPQSTKSTPKKQSTPQKYHQQPLTPVTSKKQSTPQKQYQHPLTPVISQVPPGKKQRKRNNTKRTTSICSLQLSNSATKISKNNGNVKGNIKTKTSLSPSPSTKNKSRKQARRKKTRTVVYIDSSTSSSEDDDDSKEDNRISFHGVANRDNIRNGRTMEF